MCRFLIIKSSRVFDTSTHLEKFSKICKDSEEFQGHGWGVYYLLDDGWNNYKSIKPIWEEKHVFKTLPKTSLLVAHARSAFNENTIALENTQPFQHKDWLFVFNGEITGVRLNVAGSIGAHKIFNLIRKGLKDSSPEQAISKTKDLIEKNSKYIKALNIGLINKNNAYVLCRYNERQKYFTLHFHKENGFSIICSKGYDAYRFKPMQNNQVMVI